MLFSGKLSMEMRSWIALAFILISMVLVLLGLDKFAVGYLVLLGPLGAVIAGAFYTMGVTTPLSMVVIVELMRLENPIGVAILASLSAALIDCLLFAALKDTLEHSTRSLMAKIHAETGKYSAAFPFFGFFVFGLPVPDEFGLALMGITKLNLMKIGTIVFCAKLITLAMVWKAL